MTLGNMLAGLIMMIVGYLGFRTLEWSIRGLIKIKQDAKKGVRETKLKRGKKW